MVTGDHQKTAAAAAKKPGIDYEADVLPEKKAEVVKKLQAAGAIVAMAGDGVNDSATLAQYPAESVLRFLLQRARRALGSGCALSILRTALEPNDCRRCHAL